MICAKCGRSFNDTIKFCTSDGTRLQRDTEDTMSGEAESTMAGEVTMMGDVTMVGDEFSIPEPEDIRIRVRDQSKVRDVRPGDHLGIYQVIDQIGQGGMATVFLAEHPYSGKRVAIKLLNPRLPKESAAVERFIQEARAINSVGHRNIIDIIGFDKLPDGRHYIVLEYLDGETLQQHLSKHGALPLAKVLTILKAISSALDAAHALNFVHRDLKPENVFLERPDSLEHMLVKLLDFGAAKLVTEEDEESAVQTKTGIILGTPDYMSPEQCDGEAIDIRSDIYSLGMLTYEMLTGKLPFTGDSFFEVMSKRLTNDPPPPSKLAPSLTTAFDAPILRVLSRSPEARYASAGEFAVAMENAAMSLVRGASAARATASRANAQPAVTPPGAAPGPAAASTAAATAFPGGAPPAPQTPPGSPAARAQDSGPGSSPSPQVVAERRNLLIMVLAALIVIVLGLSIMLIRR